MQFGMGTTAEEFVSPFDAEARPLALPERAGDGAPAWFEPDDSVDLWADVRPVAFAARPRIILSGHAPASAFMATNEQAGPVAEPAPLVSVAAATPVHLPRPVVALVSDHDHAAPDASVVALRPAPAEPADRPVAPPLVISA